MTAREDLQALAGRVEAGRVHRVCYCSYCDANREHLTCEVCGHPTSPYLVRALAAQQQDRPTEQEDRP